MKRSSSVWMLLAPSLFLAGFACYSLLPQRANQPTPVLKTPKRINKATPRGPGFVVRSIVISRTRNKFAHEAKITLFVPDGEEIKSWQMGHSAFLDGQWRSFSHVQVAPVTPDTSLFAPRISTVDNDSVETMLKSRLPICGPTGRVRNYYILWNTYEMKMEPRRNVIVTTSVGFDGKSMLEIAFYAKRNGRLTLGNTLPVTRPGQPQAVGTGPKNSVR